MSVPNMSVPEKCSVLVVGGGPGGSYTASCLAREGISVVLLEAEVFPRYHVGESMLPSMRHFLKFIDCYEKFNAHGFRQKNGGAFRLNWSRPESYTDFIAAGGPEGYSWNVVRSEADDIMFRHAGQQGAQIFDGTKVTGIQFEPFDEQTVAQNGELPAQGKPVSATWSRKDGSSGMVNFDYIVDASGRAGIINTKYMKNRRFNDSLKNVASWAYWKNGGTHAVGTYKEGAPYFEALKDASGWVWFIPLHNGTHSVGIVMNQEKSTKKKKAMGSPSSKEFYMESLNLVPGIKALLSKAELITEIKAASDWSYSSTSYSSPYARVVGDAGCFVDPFFSSGVHLALSSALSAAVTISASIRGDVSEKDSAEWHNKKVSEGYTRFLVVVMASLKQIREQDAPVLNDFDESSFDRAFSHFRPIIQGTVDADAKNQLSQSEVANSVEFAFKAFQHVPLDEKEAMVAKLKNLGLDGDLNDESQQAAIAELSKTLSPQEINIMNTLRARRMVRAEDSLNIENFTIDSINGMAPQMVRGQLTLIPAKKAAVSLVAFDKLALMNGEKLVAHNMPVQPVNVPAVAPAATAAAAVSA